MVGNLNPVTRDLRENIPDKEWNFLRKFANSCGQAGGRVYLVGGSVRSALVGENILDCDVEVFGIPPHAVETILAGLVQFNSVGKSFGIYKVRGFQVDIGLPRVERKTGEGHKAFSVEIRPDLTLREAALRRDFTVNAVYMQIPDGQIIDPLGGIKDLESGILRHCSERFAEDPLRVLRAMQFAARLPAEVCPETVSICRDLSPESLSRERFQGEWEKLILSGKRPSNGLAFLRQCGWLKYFPGLQAMDGCPQDPRWHPEGDVWQHTLHCMDAFARNRCDNREDDLIVGLAVLCHDMGKPATTRVIEGTVQSHGHETAGLKPARAFMEQIKTSNRLIDRVLPLVQCHMRPAMLFKDQSSPAAIRRLARDSGRLDLLLRLFQADSSGRPPYPDNSAEAISWIHGRMEKLAITNTAPKPILKGRHLLQRGWESGPQMGRILTRAYEAQLDGKFDDETGAVKWLENQSS